MKKFLILGFLGCALSASLSAQTIASLAFAEEADWPPFTPHEAGLVTSGYSYELITTVFNRLGIKISLETFPMKRVLSLIASGDKDGATVISKNAEREAIMSFSDSYLEKKGLVYYAKSRAKAISWTTFSDLKGIKIGIVSGDNYGEEFDQAVKDLGLTTDLSSDTETGFRKLAAGRIDVMLAVNFVAAEFLKKPEFTGKFVAASKPYTQKTYHIGISKKSPGAALLPKINQTLAALKVDGSLAALAKKYFGE